MAEFEAKLALVMANQETLQKENAKLKSQHDLTEKANAKLRAELGDLKKKRNRPSASTSSVSTELHSHKRNVSSRTAPQTSSRNFISEGDGGDGSDDDNSDSDDVEDDDDGEDGKVNRGHTSDQRVRAKRRHKRHFGNMKQDRLIKTDEMLVQLEKLSSDRTVQELKRENDKYRTWLDVVHLSAKP
jgi:hypothetical protein